MSSDKKQWATPNVRPIDRTVFEAWNRDKLQHLRELVQRALEMIEASGEAPESIAKLRLALDEIDAELAK